VRTRACLTDDVDIILDEVTFITLESRSLRHDKTVKSSSENKAGHAKIRHRRRKTTATAAATLDASRTRFSLVELSRDICSRRRTLTTAPDDATSTLVRGGRQDSDTSGAVDDPPSTSRRRVRIDSRHLQRSRRRRRRGDESDR